MKILSTFVCTSVFVLNSIELSSQSDLNSNIERNPSRSSPGRQPSSDSFSTPEEPHSRNRSRSPPHLRYYKNRYHTFKENYLCARSLVSGTSPPGSSPPGRFIFVEELGYTLKQLGHVRLIPRTNQNRKFEFRKYVFPVEKQIKMCLGKSRYGPLTSQEYIVLSTSDGEVFAFIEYNMILRGMYKADRNHTRIKINMITQKISDMTPDETQECQVGRLRYIFPKNFEEVVGDHDSLAIEYH